MYLDGEKIDIFYDKYQNEIITNLSGQVIKKKLLLENGKKIKLFAKNKKDLPKSGDKVEFKTAHLSTYKGNIQILIHSKKDYKVVK